jgi:two-component system sensor histidine kinase EvgS
VRGGDPEHIRSAAHKLKGSSRTLGAILVGAVAAQIEQAAVDGDLSQAKGRVRELEVVFSLSRAALTDAIEALGGAGPAPAAHPAESGSLRALLADDDPIALAVLRAGVERLGHDCTVVTDGVAALSAYQREHPQVVITDLQMPGLGGTEFARRIRAGGDTATYVVVLSASADGVAAELGQNVDAGLVKPVREDELRAVLALAAQRASV